MEKYISERNVFNKIIKEKIETALGVNIHSVNSIPIVDNPNAMYSFLGLRLDVLKQIQANREDDVFIMWIPIELDEDKDGCFISSLFYDLDDGFIRREINKITGAEIVANGIVTHDDKRYMVFKWYAGFA